MSTGEETTVLDALVGNCTEVCPQGLAPTASIIRLRQMATRRLFGLSPRA